MKAIFQKAYGSPEVLELRDISFVVAPQTCTHSQGTLVLVGGSGGPWLMGTERTLRALMLSPFVRQRLRGFLSQPKKEDLAVLKTLVEAGKVTPVIDRTYPLSEVPDAMRYLEQQHPGGKLVITM